MGTLLTSGAGAWAALAAGVAGFTFAGVKSVSVFAEIESSQLRTEALLRSTGLSAGRTSSELDSQARSIARATLASTQDIRQAQQILLTFRTVQEESFDRAIELSQDLADVLGTKAKDAALQLGKALESPEIGLTALRRSGVSFSETEQELIKNLAETGRLAEAQGLILDKLALQIGGASTGAAGGLAGQTDSLKQEWEELLEAFAQSGPGKIAESVLEGVTNKLAQFRRQLRPTIEERLAQIDAQLAATNVEIRAREAIEGESRVVQELRDRVQTLNAQRHEQITILAANIAAEKALQEQAASSAETIRQQAEEERKAAEERRLADERAKQAGFVGPLPDDQMSQIKRAQAMEQLVITHQNTMERIHEQELQADDKLVELEELRHQRRLRELEEHAELLRERGFTNVEIERQLMQAREQLERTHQANITDIQEQEQQKRAAAQRALFDMLSKGAMAADKERVAFAIQLAADLLDARKMEAVKEALVEGRLAIQKAWASAPFPANLPGVAITTAQTAANVAAIRGVAHGGLDYVPREGTFLLDRGEGVLRPNINRELGEFLKAGGRGGSVSINVTNNAPVNVSAREAGVDENGTRQYEIIIDTMRRAVESGELDEPLQGSFGLSRSGGSRG